MAEDGSKRARERGLLNGNRPARAAFVMIMPVATRTISRLLAIWLVVLIVVPFTAPWGVCDLADLTGHQPSHSDGLAKPNVSPDETIVALTNCTFVGPVLQIVADRSIHLADLIAVAPRRHTVLRL